MEMLKECTKHDLYEEKRIADKFLSLLAMELGLTQEHEASTKTTQPANLPSKEDEASTKTTQPANSTSEIHLSTKKNMKVDYIRVINCLCELGFFTDANGNHIDKKYVMEAFGKAVDTKLSDFHNHLSSTKSKAIDSEPLLRIFKEMLDKQQDILDKLQKKQQIKK
jgi:hypothetical protein